VREAALGQLVRTQGVSPSVGERALASDRTVEQILGLALVARDACEVPASAIAPLAASPDVDVRCRRAMTALSRLQGVEAAALLYVAMDDDIPRVREEAVRGLQSFASEDVAKRVVHLLDDPSAPVGRAAAATLAASMAPAMREELAKRAVEAARHGESPQLVAALLRAGNEEVRGALATGLASSDPAARTFAAM
jgi:hypothetical protein